MSRPSGRVAERLRNVPRIHLAGLAIVTLPPEYVNAEPAKGGRCFVVLDTRYLPQRNTAVGQIVFDDHERARLVLLKKVNAGAVYERAREERREAGVTHSATGAAPGPRRRRE